jgi:hypothetical protein
MGCIIAWSLIFKRTKHKSWFFLSLILFLLFIWAILHITPVQNWLVKKVTDNLSVKLHANLSVRHIDYSFFDNLDLTGLMVEDQHKDTLLYAGTARISITDWFFLKDKAILQHVELEDAIVNMQRTDSVWNYQFLVDYFSSPKQNADTAKGIEFELKELKLRNIVFRQIDKWKGADLIVSLKYLALNADTIDLHRKRASISKLEIDEPQFSQSDYPGNRGKVNIVLPPPPPGITLKKSTWVMDIQNIRISNGIFSSEKENLQRAAFTDRFDGSHIRFSKINASFTNVHYEKDSISTNVKLSTKERSGFEVKKLEAKMKFTPEIMEFNDLELVTGKSTLRNYYAMRYKDFNADMGHFERQVNVEANFVNSEIHSDDIGFFAPELKTWKRAFKISGNAKGTVDNFTARKMLIKSGNSIVNGEIVLKGLPDIENTFIDFRAKELQTTYADLSTILPSLKRMKQPKLDRLGDIKYKGNFTGFVNDFVAFGTINTNLGTVTGDLNLKLPEGRNAIYSGKISTRGFKLGEFVDNRKLGAISFDGKVNGSGFSTTDLDAKFDGNIASIEFDGYNYQNIILKGEFKKKLFNGFASIDDPNLKLEKLTGSIDLNGTQPQFNFDAQLAKADFKKIGLTKDVFALKGHFNFNFTGNNIDNFLGTAKMTDASLLHNDLPLSFDSLVLTSQIENGEKYLSLHSTEVDADIFGRFKIIELPGAFKVFLNRYYPAYIKKPSYEVSDQDFSFEIKTRNFDEYANLLNPKLKGFNNSVISGNLKLKNNELNIHVAVPEFSYDDKIFNNIRLHGKGSLDSLVTTVDVDDVAISDSLHLPSTNLVFSSFNDTSNISLKTRASKTVNDASVNARLVTMNDGLKIHFFPSSFIINDKKWQLEQDGEIAFNKSNVSASEVKFVQGNQQIKIATEPSEQLNKNDVVVELTKLNMEDFASYGIKEPKLQGLLSGTVRISDPFGKPFIESDNIVIEEFKSDNDSIGLLKASASFNTRTSLLLFKAKSDNKDNSLDIDGSINLKDSTSNQIFVGIKSEKFDLSILNTYLGDLFSNIQGSANTTDLAFSGNAKHLYITGTANINEGSLVVNYTQCKYKFKNESIVLNRDEIDFGKIELKDTLNNTATVSGKMYHRFFKNIEFDNVLMEADRLLVLNTTKKDNSQFYGKVIGKARLLLTGNQESIFMDITGEPSRRDSSHIYIVSGNSIENGVIDYIDFIQFGNRMEETFKTKSAASILVNMEVTGNPSCKVDVILDETTGDIIKGEGEGLLKIRVGNREPLTINGRYEILNGEYTFNFQTFLKKYFTINSGTLVWDGDPFQARIDIIAEYLAENVDFSSLSANSAVGSSAVSFNQRSDLRVMAHLTETLLKPAIDFELQLPANTTITDFLVLKRLEQFRDDKNELNKQITSLLLFNSFINTNQGFLTASGGYSVIAGTIGGVVSNAISGFFNNLLQKYVKNLAFNFDLNTSLGTSSDLQSNVEQLQAAAKSNFVYTVLNGRLIISAGLNLDYNNPYANINRNTNLLITPDITVEWILSPDGRFRVVGFNRTNYDLVGQRNRTGASLSYRKDIDRLSQIFKSKKAQRKEEQKKTGSN